MERSGGHGCALAETERDISYRFQIPRVLYRVCSDRTRGPVTTPLLIAGHAFETHPSPPARAHDTTAGDEREAERPRAVPAEARVRCRAPSPEGRRAVQPVRASQTAENTPTAQLWAPSHNERLPANNSHVIEWIDG